MPESSEALTAADVTRLTHSAVAKIDTWGTRGATMVTVEEIEAMALTITSLSAALSSGILDWKGGA